MRPIGFPGFPVLAALLILAAALGACGGEQTHSNPSNRADTENLAGDDVSVGDGMDPDVGVAGPDQLGPDQLGPDQSQAPIEEYLSLGDGAAYHKLGSMLESLTGLPDYQVAVPPALDGRPTGREVTKGAFATAKNGAGDWTVIEQGALDDFVSWNFNTFENEAQEGDSVSLTRILVRFLRDYLDETVVPQGLPVGLGPRSFTYDIAGNAQHPLTGVIDGGRMVWYRDDDSGSYQIFWKVRDPLQQVLASLNAEAAHPDPDLHFYTISGTPALGDDEHAEVWRFEVHQAFPVKNVSDYNGRGMDHSFLRVTYDERDGEVTYYYRGLDQTWSTGRSDDIYQLSSYTYKYFHPVRGSENDEVLLHVERLVSPAPVELDPVTGMIRRWCADMAPGEQQCQDRSDVTMIQRFSAWGHQEASVLSHAGLAGEGKSLVLDFYNRDGHMVASHHGQTHPDQVPPYLSLVENGHNLHQSGDTTPPPLVWTAADGAALYVGRGEEGVAPILDPDTWLEMDESHRLGRLYWRADSTWSAGDRVYMLRAHHSADGIAYHGFVPAMAVPAPVDIMGAPHYFFSTTPLKYLELSTPGAQLVRTPSGLYFHDTNGNSTWDPDEPFLDILHFDMGRYSPTMEWETVGIPFLTSVSIPDFAVQGGLSPELIDEGRSKALELIARRTLHPLLHPAHRSDAGQFDLLLAFGGDGIWVLDEESAAEEGFGEVLVLSSSPEERLFEARRYALAPGEGFSAGLFSAVSGTFFVDRRTIRPEGEEHHFYGYQMAPDRYYVHFLEDWDEYTQNGRSGSLTDLPTVARNPGAPIRIRRDGRTLFVRHREGVGADALWVERRYHFATQDPWETLVGGEPGDDPNGGDEPEDPVPGAGPELLPYRVSAALWAATPEVGHYIELSLQSEIWQEAHYQLDGQSILLLRSFRGTHELFQGGDGDTASGVLQVTGYLRAPDGEWAEDEDLAEALAADGYLQGLDSLEVSMEIGYDTLRMDRELAGGTERYWFQRQNPALSPVERCLSGQCVSIEASQCLRAQGGLFAGRGMSEPTDQWNDPSVVGPCLENCTAHFLCGAAERSAMFIDCANMGGLCSADFSPIHPMSCTLVRSFAQMNANHAACKERCQLDREVAFPDPAVMTGHVQACLDKY